MINVLDPEYDNVHLATILLAQAGVQLSNGAAIVSFHIDVDKAVIVVDDESTLVYELQACRKTLTGEQNKMPNVSAYRAWQRSKTAEEESRQ